MHFKNLPMLQIAKSRTVRHSMTHCATKMLAVLYIEDACSQLKTMFMKMI